MTARRKPAPPAVPDPAADPSAPPAPAAAPLDAPPVEEVVPDAAPNGVASSAVTPQQTGVLLAESNVANGLELVVLDAATLQPIRDVEGLFEADPPYGSQVRCTKRLLKRVTADGRPGDYLLLPQGALIPGTEADRITALIRAQLTD